ncbi:MAG: AMP-binding protein, partial [Caulobacteraceae bacterium]|nr:AMP-binding protein [Caulobacteraceae bacterium]
IAKHRITATSGTPFHLTSLLDAADAGGADLSCLTDYLAGATMIPPALIERCEKRGLATYRCYGMSEHPTISRGTKDDPLEKRLNTDGRLCPGVEVRIVDEDGRDVSVGDVGEILSRGPDRFVGYTDAALNAEAIEPGGWLRTGDIGRLDTDGFLAIVDRKKDVIIRGGENIASREVEDLLSSLPGVREAAVVGAPHPTLGEQVCAFVVVDEGADVSLKAVSAHFAAAGIARQKTPERIEPVLELPRNAAGKVLKPELRSRLRG